MPHSKTTLTQNTDGGEVGREEEGERVGGWVVSCHCVVPNGLLSSLLRIDFFFACGHPHIKVLLSGFVVSLAVLLVADRTGSGKVRVQRTRGGWGSVGVLHVE